MEITTLYGLALLIFFIGWLIARAKSWGVTIAIAGAALFVVVGFLDLFGLLK